MDEQQVKDIINRHLAYILKHDKVVFSELVQFLDGRNIQLGRTTGTQIATDIDQKLGFFGEVPVVQQGAVSTPSSAGAVYSQSQVQSIVDAVNQIRVALQNLGLTA